ncbi:MAG: hypothetical protein UZ19_OD1000921 [Parcubacteria bacterium OLB19]|nr:MAG: hypothetical protein UZ19_OD1000921 [Parcubacteria bacterium OLB19]
MKKKTKKNIWYITLVVVEALCIIALSFMIFVLLQDGFDNYGTNENQSPQTAEEQKTDFLTDEEGVMIIENPDKGTESPEEVIIPINRVLFEYIEVFDSCGPHFEGECLNARSGPGTDYPATAKLRKGVVLKVDGEVERDNGEIWYKVVFDEWLRYPERVKGDWYVNSDYVEVLLDEGDKTIWDHGKATSTKEIIVDRSEQKLYAYENDELFMEISISTGLELTPTPRGTFTVFKKTPSRYMQGPLPNLIDQQYYDLPGVPWNLYFTDGGAVIHGAYWHNSFGRKYSHGCVNVPIDKARELYSWTPLGTKVTVKD